MLLSRSQNRLINGRKISLTDFFALSCLWSTEILNHLKHLRSGPEHYFRCPLCAFKTDTGILYPSRHSGCVIYLINQAYSEVRDEEIPHLTHTNFQARELRAITSYLAFHQNYSLKQIIGTATWRNSISLFLLLWQYETSLLQGMELRLALSWLVQKSFPEDIWVIVRKVVVVCWQFLPLSWTH